MYSTDEAGLAVSPKKLSARYHLCHELLGTESNYVEVLKIILVGVSSLFSGVIFLLFFRIICMHLRN